MSNEKSAAIESVIGCGRFQILVFITCQWVVFAQAWNLVAIVFNKIQPTWTCWDVEKVGEAGGDEFSTIRPQMTEYEKQCGLRSKCQNLTYSYNYYSFVTEWNLVCGQEHILYLLMTIQMAGVLVGAPIFGQLSDSFGRKWTLLAETAGIIITGGISAACPTWRAYAAFLFFTGFFCGGSIITGYVLMVELLSHKHRLWVPAIGGWPIAFALLSLLAYMAQNWRILTIMINVLSLPSIGLIIYMGESPRWLLQAGRIDEAIAQMKRVSRINRSDVDQDQWTILMNGNGQENSKKELGKKYSYWHLFSTKKMALHTVILSFTFFCLSAISFGLTFNVDKLSGSIFLNFFFMACLRWIGSMLTIGADTMIKKFGRKVGVILPSLAIAVAAAVVVILHLANPTLPSLDTVTRILLLVAAALCSPMWIEMPLANNELFPTSIRNIAVAFISIFNRLGAVVMPQVLYLALFWKPSPYVAYVVLSVILAGLFAIFIPETKGQPLPQQMPKKSQKRSESGTERSNSFAVYKFVNVDQSQTPFMNGERSRTTSV